MDYTLGYLLVGFVIGWVLAVRFAVWLYDREQYQSTIDSRREKR